MPTTIFSNIPGTLTPQDVWSICNCFGPLQSFRKLGNEAPCNVGEPEVKRLSLLLKPTLTQSFLVEFLRPEDASRFESHVFTGIETALPGTIGHMLYQPTWFPPRTVRVGTPECLPESLFVPGIALQLPDVPESWASALSLSHLSGSQEESGCNEDDEMGTMLSFANFDSVLSFMAAVESLGGESPLCRSLSHAFPCYRELLSPSQRSTSGTPSPPRESEIPEVDGVKFVKKLGEGNNGVVMKAVWDGKEVAAKVLRQDSGHLDRELAVIQHLQKYNCPPRLFAHKDLPGEMALICMELLGVDLFELAAEKQFTEVMSLVCAEKMLKALSPLHSSGIFHGSVKPENFCFSKSVPDKLVLIDFGRAAKESESPPVTDVFHGWWYGNRVLLGHRYHRADDYESLLHSIGYLLQGRLYTKRRRRIRDELHDLWEDHQEHLSRTVNSFKVEEIPKIDWQHEVFRFAVEHRSLSLELCETMPSWWSLLLRALFPFLYGATQEGAEDLDALSEVFETVLDMSLASAGRPAVRAAEQNLARFSQQYGSCE